MKCYHSQGNGWELENIILSEVRFRRPKVAYSPSYADYRPKTNSHKWNTGHTKGRLHTGWIGQSKETKNLNVIDVPTSMRSEED
jgi:hypothetical protein